MGTARTAFARANARLSVLSGIAAVVFLLAGLGTVVVDSLSGAALGGLRAGLEGASGPDGAVRWQIRMAQDAAAQADAAASVLDRTLVPAGATWTRTVQTSPVEARAGGSEIGAVLLADESLAEHARLVAGLWPEHPEAVAAARERGAAPATLLVTAADELGLAPGDLVTPIDDGRPLLIVGTWHPVDASAPRWFGEPILAGTVGSDAGPFVVTEQVAVEAGAPAFVRWTATPDVDDVSPERAAELRAVLPNVEPALRDQREMGASGLSTLGGLEATLDRLLAGIGAVRAIAPLPVLLLAFAGVAALTRLAAILAASRRGETVLLRARGATGLRLARDTALEVLVVGVPAALLGVAAAQASLGLIGPGAAHDPLIPWLAASVAVVAAVVLVAGRAWLDARHPMLRGAGDEVGRMPRTALAGGAILIIVAAAIALWQFRLYGSPLVVAASGATEVDPLAVLAPVLALLALSIAVLALARPLGTGFERAAARRPALVPALPVRQVARRAALYASATLVTTLSVSGLTLTALIAGSWQAIDRDVAALETGGDVRVVLPGRDLVRGPDPAATDDRFATLDGVTADAPVFRGEVRIGSDSAQLVAGPADSLAAAAPGTGIEGVAALEDSAVAAATPLPAGAAILDVPVVVQAPAGTTGRVSISAWLLGPGGAATRLPAGEFDVASAGGTARIALPDAAPLRLLGLQASLAGGDGAEGVRVDLGRLAADGVPVEADVARTLELSSTEPDARVSPATGGADPLPVVLSADLAQRISAEAGGEFAFRLVTGGTEIDAVVAGVVPVVPTGGTSALLVDLGALARVAFDAGGGVPQFGERWLAASDPAGVAGALDADRGADLSVTMRADASSAPFIALASALAGSRFGEIVVLRAMGVPPRIQASARFAELAVTVGTAVVAGVLVGALTAAVTARELARAAVAGTPDVLVTALAVDWGPWLFGILAFVVLASAIALLAARAVRRLASRPGLREEER